MNSEEGEENFGRRKAGIRRILFFPFTPYYIPSKSSFAQEVDKNGLRK